MKKTNLLALLAATGTTTFCHGDDTTTTRIAGYQAKSSITGSKIDLDQAEMERQLAVGDFVKAKQIYMKGAHSNPYAVLTLETPLPHIDLGGSKHIVVGMNDAHRAIYGTVGNLQKGSTTLYVNYDEEENLEHPCVVGGRLDPQTEGCFASKGGLIIEGYGAIDYHYDLHEGNQFWSSLWGFSEHEAERMFHCHDKCPYPEYEKFYKYYGQMDYGTVWVEAALDGRTTEFGAAKFEHGNEDFSLLDQLGRAAAVKTATVTMNIRTQVNRIMTEWSIDRCRQDCQNGECPQAAVPWDQAVAIYVGSLEGPDGTGHGNLFYSLADQLCTEFATCGPNRDDFEGTSGVNLDIMQQFQSGRSLLEAGNCPIAEITYGEVVHLMTVPLIQGTLRAAYRLQFTHKRDAEERGRAAAFVASIIPDLYSCSQMDASIVYNEMKLENTGAPNFADVKEALERNYQCLSVACADVGGLYDANMDRYLDGAHPCGKRRASKRGRTRPNRSIFFGSGRGFLICNVVIFGILVATRKRWVPAVSSRIDILLSAGTSRFDSNDVRERYNLGSNAGFEISDSADYHQIPEEEEAVEMA